MTRPLRLGDVFMKTHGLPVLILCADDYGLSPGVSRGIRELIATGRLSATSCMTLFPEWPNAAADLKPLDGRADVGLHLTLTDHPPLGPMPDLAPGGRLPPLGALMKRALARRLDAAEVAGEVERQLAAFETAMGRPPDFIDGHQHVHQLPVIRDAVLAALARRPGAYVRLCRESPWAIVRRGVAVPKTLVIAALGWPLAAAAHRAGTPANTSFRGVYGFSADKPFLARLARFLAPARGGALVMVHPGHPDDVLRARDAVTGQRALEYEALSGTEFPMLLDRLGVRLGRFRESA
jgi:chitin disaccharide deacetylase